VTTVLLVEDDRPLRRALRASFRSWGFDVQEAGRGEEALTLLTDAGPDIIVLDLRLPGIDGLETLRHLRTFTSVPVIVLTVRDELRDKVAAFESGADDYVVKPFESDELLARARAHVRRHGSAEAHAPVVHSGPLLIDLTRGRVTWEDTPVLLTPTELRLLEILLEHRGTLVTKQRLLEAIWGSRRPSDETRLRVFVQHLRRKLHDDAARPRLIFTEPGLGYRWISEDEQEEPDDADAT
jgi:two-component system KDP operon response regulator KdpE